MDAVTYDHPEDEWDRYGDEPADSDRMPGRPRRQYFNRWSAALVALITCGIGFYAGVRVEKGQVSSSSSAAPSAAAGFAARARGVASRAGGVPGSAATGGGGASFGTVSSARGATLYVTTSSGNTVKVKLSSSTKISKNVSVGRKSVRPGDTVVIQGLTNSSGTLVAAAVIDSGTGGGGGSRSGGGSGSGSGGGSGSGSGVGSLFSSGGGG
jgi:hypothetical protein